MKRIANFIIIFVISMILVVPVVEAAGTANENIVANNTVANGANISIDVTLSGISNAGGGSLASYQGTFQYDSDYFDYVSFSSKAPFSISFGATTKKWIGAADDPNKRVSGSSSNMFTIVLKAKKVGTTTVSTVSSKAGDVNGDLITLNQAAAKTITITDSTTTKSSNNFLSSLSISGYSITPVFDKNVTNYTLKVPNSASSVIVNATKEDSKAQVNGTGTKNLIVGENVINVIVTAENNSTRTYKITVTREADVVTPPPVELSDDATLKSLSISGYTLSPSFKKNVTNYSITIPKTVNSVNVNAIANNSKATVVVSGNSGFSSGTNNIKIKVTAEDGTVQTYIVTVKREEDKEKPTGNKSSNNYLKGLNIKDQSINFNKNTNSYSLVVPYEIDQLDISSLVEDPKAKVEIIGNKNLKVNQVNVVEVKVTAEDGSIRIYTLNVTRSSMASNNKLSDLEVKDYNISPKFNPDTEEYNLTVDNSVEKLDILWKTKDTDTKVYVSGNDNLKVGNNLVRVKVVDKNGFERIYFINVERKAESTVLGVNPFIFFSLLTLFLMSLILLLILLFRRKKQREELNKVENPIPSININVSPNFTPDVNIGSKNNSDFATDNARFITNGKAEEKKTLEYKEAEYVDVSEGEDFIATPREKAYYNDELFNTLFNTISFRMDHEDEVSKEKYDLDKLMEALTNKEIDTIKWFITQVEADDMKIEARGLNPDRFDNLWDDEVTVHEVVNAIKQYLDNGDKQPMKILIKQYSANKYKERSKKRKNRINRYKNLDE